MKKLKIAFILNVVLFVLVVFATGWMMTSPDGGPLRVSGLAMLKFFTVDSNILMGVVAALVAFEQWQVLSGKRERVSRRGYLLKLMGTASVTLTMLVTVFFLTPTTYATNGLFGLFAYSNFFMHLLNPVLALVVFVGFEKADCLKLKDSLMGVVPMLVYAVYYVGEAVTHSHDGIIEKGYDWYGFCFAGLQSAVVVVPIILLVTLGISVVLWRLNRAKP